MNFPTNFPTQFSTNISAPLPEGFKTECAAVDFASGVQVEGGEGRDLNDGHDKGGGEVDSVSGGVGEGEGSGVGVGSWDGRLVKLTCGDSVVGPFMVRGWIVNSTTCASRGPWRHIRPPPHFQTIVLRYD
jgi:hypothetical protein